MHASNDFNISHHLQCSRVQSGIILKKREERSQQQTAVFFSVFKSGENISAGVKKWVNCEDADADSYNIAFMMGKMCLIETSLSITIYIIYIIIYN